MFFIPPLIVHYIMYARGSHRRRGARFVHRKQFIPRTHPQNGVFSENLDGYCYYFDNKTVAQHDIFLMV